MLKAYKYRIKPTKAQELKLNQFFGCSRFIYNWGLNRKSEVYSNENKNLSVFDLIKEATQLKKDDNFAWLSEVHSQPLQMSLRNLDIAYTGFFKKKAGFPKFKKKSNRQSFQYPQGVKISENKVFLPKIGWVKFFNSREFTGDIKTVTVSKNPSGEYYVSILVDNRQELPSKKPIQKSTSVGLDFGIKDLVITSDGEVFENQKHFHKMKAKLKVAQISLARKQKGSKSRERQRLKVAKLHQKVTNQRMDYLHKISSYLVNQYDTICIEDLSVESMLKEKRLSSLISDASWSTLRSLLAYKCEWSGKNLQVIGRFEPSSKRCNNCGNIKQNLKLSKRTYNCEKCNANLDRDLNAALNIKDYGLGHSLCTLM
jgi:putative transposase